MHTNLDFAIASVIEHGQALDIPNVFAAYLQRVIACELSDGSTITETEAIARAALVSFERAMDKYPMAPPARSSKTKTKTKKTLNPKAPAHCSPSLKTATPRAPGAKLYSVEVEQLRWDYQRAMWRATMGYDDPGCTCLSCGSLLALRERADMLSAQCEDLMARCEEYEQHFSHLVPAPKRRARESGTAFLSLEHVSHAALRQGDETRCEEGAAFALRSFRPVCSFNECCDDLNLGRTFLVGIAHASKRSPPRICNSLYLYQLYS